MSQETYKWLSKYVLAGFAETRRPWWANHAESEGWSLDNLFQGPVPMERVRDLLTSWQPYDVPLYDIDMKQAKVTLYDADMNPVQAVPVSAIDEVDSHKQIKASDNRQRLSVVGIDYETHPYGDWLTGTVQECVGDDAQVSSAGLLRNRAQAWVQIERPETSVGPGGIRFSPFIVISTSVDTSLATQTNQNNRMVICDNTLAIGRGQGLAFLAKHTKGSSSRLGDQRGVMMRLIQGESDFKAELERELSVKVDDVAFQRFIEAFVPEDEDDSPNKKTRTARKRQEITALYKGDDRVAEWKGTMFGVVQAVNTWQTHLSQLKNGTKWDLTDTDLRAMRNYAQNLRPTKGDSPDQFTVKVLESVLA